MNILYFGKICDNDLFKKKEKNKQPYFIAQYMYEKALCDEFLKNEELDLEIISIYQTEYFPKDSLFFYRNSKEKNKIDYLKFINLPYLRELTYFISACIHIIKWYIKHKGEKNKCIYSSCHFAPVSLAIVIMGKLLSIKRIVTFTDLSLFTYSSEKINKMKVYKKIIMRPYVYLVNMLQKSYDAYILFSKKMNEIVNLNKKPYLVIEGIYNSQHLNLDDINTKANAIAHAGTLNKEYGIEKILNVFALIDDPTLELWLIGKGDMTNEIIEKSKHDNRIKYLGFMQRSEVFEKLKKARLLVNLRNTDDVYTKYSFPSKMFEYMASGTPVLTTKLEGIPHEYYNYLYTTESYNDEVIKNKIVEILNKNDKDRLEFGMKARKYILNEKNSRKQVQKIVNFLRNIFKV